MYRQSHSLRARMMNHRQFPSSPRNWAAVAFFLPLVCWHDSLSVVCQECLKSVYVFSSVFDKESSSTLACSLSSSLSFSDMHARAHTHAFAHLHTHMIE